MTYDQHLTQGLAPFVAYRVLGLFKAFHIGHPAEISQQSCEVSTIIILIFLMKLREVK